jgi:hypothetical protein
MVLRTSAGLLFAAMAAASFGSARAGNAGLFDNLVQSRYVHCAFYRDYEIDPVSGNRLLAEDKSDSLAHYQAIDGRRARTITTRMAGAREARVMQTGKRLHFIDRVAGMYIVTTVHTCLHYDERRSACLTYGAMNARHFDSRVLLDPDGVFENLRAHADPGFCDYSFIGVRESAPR